MQRSLGRDMSGRTTDFSFIEELSALSESAVSALAPLNNQIRDNEVMRDAKIDELEMEIMVLRRQLPKLKKLDGRNVTNEIALMLQHLDDKSRRIEGLEAELHDERRRHSEEIDFRRKIQDDHIRKTTELGRKIQDMSSKIDDTSRLSAADIISVRQEAAEVQTDILAEYTERIEQLEADVFFYQTEIETTKTQLTEVTQKLEDVQREQGDAASDLEERYANAIEEIEHLKVEVANRDQIIKDLRSTAGTQNEAPGDKPTHIHCLMKDLRRIYYDWEQNTILKSEIDKLLDKCDDDETFSERCEKLQLNRDRLTCERELGGSDCDLSYASTPDLDICNNVTKSAANVVQRSRRYHTIGGKLVERLQNVLKLLVTVARELAFDDPSLMNVIKVTQRDLEIEYKDLTDALQGLESSERTLNDSIDISFRDTPTPRIDETNGLKQRLKTMEDNLRQELATKENLIHDRDLIRSRFKEATDEKLTLQREILTLKNYADKLESQLDEHDHQNAAVLIEARTRIEELTQDQERLENERQRLEDMCIHVQNNCSEREKSNKKLQKELDVFYGREAVYQEQDRMIDNVTEQIKQFQANGYFAPDVPTHKEQKAAMKQTQKILLLKRFAHECMDDNKAFAKYIEDIIYSLDGRIKRSDIACPQAVSPTAHSALMNFIANNCEPCAASLEASEKVISAKMKELTRIYNSEEASVMSDISAPIVLQTLSQITEELEKCFKKSNRLVQFVKKFEEENPSLKRPIESILDLSRDVRNVIHVANKSLRLRCERLESRTGSRTIEQLDDIHTILSPDENVRNRQNFQKSTKLIV